MKSTLLIWGLISLLAFSCKKAEKTKEETSSETPPDLIIPFGFANAFKLVKKNLLLNFGENFHFEYVFEKHG